MSFSISDIFSRTSGAAEGSSSGFMSMLPMIVLLIVFMYMMVIRPQSKKAKEHKSLMDSLQQGDEVVTIGGVLGKIEKISDDFITLSIAENTNINIQRNAISNIVPRGTMKTSL